jgi:hypothetical protein
LSKFDNAATAADLFEQEMRGRHGANTTSLDPADSGEPKRRPTGKLVADSLSGPGASKLAETIRAFWRARGHEVEVTVVPTEGFGSTFSIGPNLLDGKTSIYKC